MKTVDLGSVKTIHEIRADKVKAGLNKLKDGQGVTKAELMKEHKLSLNMFGGISPYLKEYFIRCGDFRGFANKKTAKQYGGNNG